MQRMQRKASGPKAGPPAAGPALVTGQGSAPGRSLPGPSTWLQQQPPPSAQQQSNSGQPAQHAPNSSSSSGMLTPAKGLADLIPAAPSWSAAQQQAAPPAVADMARPPRQASSGAMQTSNVASATAGQSETRRLLNGSAQQGLWGVTIAPTAAGWVSGHQESAPQAAAVSPSREIDVVDAAREAGMAELRRCLDGSGSIASSKYAGKLSILQVLYLCRQGHLHPCYMPLPAYTCVFIGFCCGYALVVC